MITAFLVGDTEVIARLNAMPGGLQSGLARAVTRLSLEGERLSKQKVSGEVLRVRTDVLRSSIHARPTQVTATAVLGGWGTNVVYARIHEFGGTIHHPGGTPYEVISGQGAVFVSLQNAKAAFLPRTRPHDIPMPERSFLRSALREMQPLIREEMEKAVRQEAERVHR